MSTFAATAVVDARPYAWPFDGELNPARTALVVGDLQVRHFAPHGLYNRLGCRFARDDPRVARCLEGLAAARAAGLAVLFLRWGCRPGLPELAPAQRRRWQRVLGLDAAGVEAVLSREGAGAGLLPEAAPLAHEPVIEHSGFNPFLGTDLANVLHKLGPRNLIFCGVGTDTVLHPAQRDANDRGYECLLLEDAGLPTRPAHAETVARATVMGNGLFGCVATTASLLHALGAG